MIYEVCHAHNWTGERFVSLYAALDRLVALRDAGEPWVNLEFRTAEQEERNGV